MGNTSEITHLFIPDAGACCPWPKKRGEGGGPAGPAAASGEEMQVEELDHLAPLGSSMTIENAKRLRAMNRGHLPSIWRRTSIRAWE